LIEELEDEIDEMGLQETTDVAGVMARHFPLPQAANEGKHQRIIASHSPGTF
jgi:hypothetical protein